MQIDYLIDHPQLVPELARLHFAEFSRLRPGESLEARTVRLQSYLGRAQLPMVVVALEEGRLLGSVSLVAEDLDTRPDLSPWLAGMYVVAHRRRQGIASKLVFRIIDEARQLGIGKLYLYTATAEAFFTHLGWALVERSVFHDAPIAVMSYQTGPGSRS